MADATPRLRDLERALRVRLGLSRRNAKVLVSHERPTAEAIARAIEVLQGDTDTSEVRHDR